VLDGKADEHPARGAAGSRGSSSEPATEAPVDAPSEQPVEALEPAPDDLFSALHDDEPTARATAAAPAGNDGRRLAFTWVDEAAVAVAAAPAADLAVAASPYVPVEPDLLAKPPRRSPLRSSVIVPTLLIAAVAGAYVATTLMWPLHAVAPTVSAVQVQPIAVPATTPAWPAVGSAAISVAGMEGVPASSADASTIASITKVVTALVVLDEMPLAVGEQGPEFRFTYGDNLSYWAYRSRGESALDVPVGGTLTQYQLLEGMLIGSANNYADRLAGNLWPSDAVFANAANSWLRTHGVPGITIVEPTGMDSGNTAGPAALIALAQKALANPVIAEIVAKQSVELPGAGLVRNTNGLLADPGVLGIKTGTLDAWNLLSAKDVPIGETTVRLYASVLGQPDDESRNAASRALYAQLESELQPRPSVTSGTTAGLVQTKWGEPVEIRTAGDASVILWNGGAGTVTTSYSLGDSRSARDVVGSLSVQGPLNATTVDLRLAADIEEPSAWWRLTHPLELLGLTD